MGRAGGSGGHRVGGGTHSGGGGRAGGGGFRPSGGGFSRSPRPSRPPRPPRTPRVGGFGHRPPPPPPMVRGYRSYGYGTGGGYGSGGCFGRIVASVGTLIILFMILAGISCLAGGSACVSCISCSGSRGNNNYADNYQPQQNNNTSYKTSKGTYYEDHLEMELNSSVFNSNMNEFKRETGLTPFVYTNSLVNGRVTPTENDLDTVYRSLGLSNTVLLVYQEKNETYGVWIYVDDNISAEKFPDSAFDVMENYIVDNYDSNMSNAELLSGAFIAALDVM